MKSFLLVFLTLCLGTIIGNMSYSQINVTSGLPNSNYAQELIGQGVLISNISVDNNNANQIGLFSNGGSTNLGLNDGLVLSTGNVNDVSNLAQFSATTSYTSIGCGFLGLEICPSNDTDLSDIAGSTIYDHSILEFDFVPTGPTITFRFVFASEEYPGYVNSSYNDAFGIFLSGPGINGPYSNNAQNIALVPGTSTPVAINNVNGGNSSGCPSTNSGCTNCAYYVNNCGGTTIVFNGFTTVITATYSVECGETYHVKFGIADAGDGALDSGVFVEANSFESSELEISPNPVTICEGNSTTLTANLEGSTGGNYYWEPGGQTTQSITVSPSVTTDYTVTYTVGTCSITDEVTVVVDNCSGDPCFMSNIEVSISPCEPNSTFAVSGFVEFTDAPTTGQLVFEDCNGNSTSFNAPFTSPTNFTVSGIAADGAPCNMNAYFTADPSCSIDVSYGNTANCDCNAYIGTFTATNASANNTTPLCYGDSFTINANGDFIPADAANNPPLNAGYDPGIAWFVYSCPPTIPFIFDPVTGDYLDPCFVGFISTENIGDLNDLSFVNQFPPGTFTNNIIYFLPVTMYNNMSGYISYVNTGESCFQVGSPYGFQYLTEITENSVENCQAGTVTTTISGGSPEINGTNFTGTNLLPASASYTVSSTSNGGNIVVSGLVDGDVYSYDIIDEFGCSVTVLGTFTGVSASDFTYGNDEYCKNESNPIPTVTGESGGVFTGAAGLSINSTTGAINLSATPAGSYTVTYTSPGAPCNSQSTFDITIYDEPTFTITYTEPSCGNQDGEIIISGLNPSTAYDLDYTLNGGQVGPTSQTTDASGSITLSNLGFGIYANFEIVGAGGCTATETISINLNPTDAPQVTAPDDLEICLGESITLTAQNPDGATISWSNGVTDGVAFTPTSAGNNLYTVSATIDGCTSTDEVTVMVHNLPNVDAGQDKAICEGETAMLTVSGAASYAWDNGQNGANITVSPAQTTTYTVTGTSVHGCINTDDVTVTVYPYPEPSFTGNPPFGCAPLTVNFTNTTANTGNSTCLWDFGDGTTSTNCNPSHTYYSSGVYDVTLTVTNSIGCESTITYTNYVEVVPSPIAAFTADPEIVNTLDPLVNFYNESENATDYVWDFGDETGTATTYNTEHDYSNASEGQFVVTLIASNGMAACNDTAQLLITVNEDLIFYVPNTFTPDSDNYNEVFSPVFSSGYDPQSYTLEIFNRWGELIFESHNVAVGWDGTYGADSKGVVKDGVYVWKIKIKETGKDKHNEYVGHVSLLK